MHKKEKSEKLFLSKLSYTFMIIAIYALFRLIPLYGVDTLAYENMLANSEVLIQQTIGGDYYQYSVMALGISPYMISTILAQIVLIFRTKEAKARTSPIKLNRLSLFITVMLAISMAVTRADRLIYAEKFQRSLYVKPLVILEMVTGALLMVWFVERNKRYGIGGQGSIFLVNLIDNTMRTIIKNSFESVKIPLMVGFCLMLLMVFMENTEKRIPLQRISIHNIYADKNYQSIKLNPIGVMPVMFASAFYLLPQMIVNMLYGLFPYNSNVVYWKQNMTLEQPLGIGIYILGLYIINIGFTFIMLSPKDITEQFLKSGDSFVGIYPGKYTRRYLRRNMLLISFTSSTIMSTCLMISFYMRLHMGIASDVAMLTTAIMMLAGLACASYQEASAIISTDSYKTFI